MVFFNWKDTRLNEPRKDFIVVVNTDWSEISVALVIILEVENNNVQTI